MEVLEALRRRLGRLELVDVEAIDVVLEPRLARLFCE